MVVKGSPTNLVMVAPSTELLSMDNLSALEEQQRSSVLAALGLVAGETTSGFQEALEETAAFLQAPLCFLGVMDQDRLWLKAAVDLSDLDIIFRLGAEGQLSRDESLFALAVKSERVLVIRDGAVDPDLGQSELVRHYGIRAYLGIPLVNSKGDFLGVLAVMDLAPRTFSGKEIRFVQMTARWVTSEWERQALEQHLGEQHHLSALSVLGDGALVPLTQQLHALKLDLLDRLTQELRNPLTSVMGMARVLSQEVYGNLNQKQKEYLGIIHGSGRYLLSLLDEIVALQELDDLSLNLDITAVDLEMLCHQVVNNLQYAAAKREQTITLSASPGNRIWMLDKVMVYQIIYHLVSRLIQGAAAGCAVCIHIQPQTESPKAGVAPHLEIQVWVSHPEFGEGIHPPELLWCSLPEPPAPVAPEAEHQSVPRDDPPQPPLPPQPLLKKGGEVAPIPSDFSGTAGSTGKPASEPHKAQEVVKSNIKLSREELGVLLSCHLADLLGGRISIAGSPESGMKYVVQLPLLAV